MSHLNCIQDFLTTSQKAFINNWSLTQREIELEFQVHKGYKSLQNSLGNSLSLDLKLLFPSKSSKSQILLFKYYVNNTTSVEKENFVSMLEKLSSIKFLLNNLNQQGMLLVKKEIENMDIGLIEEIFLTPEQKAFLDCQWNAGNFFLLLFELDEQFNFSLIVEILKIWTIFNGHIKFKARFVPSDILESLGFLTNNLEMKVLSCPFARFPINIETEALMEETFYSFGYRSSQEYYFETQEYFMNLQTLQDSLVSFKTEFNIKETSLCQERIGIEDFAVLDIISGLYLDSNMKNSKGSQNILTVVYQDRRPLLSDSEIVLKETVNNLLKNILCKLFEEQWNLKVVIPSGITLGKRKTMADCYQIMPAGIVVPSTLQILIFVNISFFSEEIFNLREKEIYDKLYGILAKRLTEIMDILCENEVYLTKKLRSCMEVPDYYVPKLTTSLANILVNFKEYLLANHEAPKVQEMLKNFDTHQSQEKIEEDLKQGFYMSLMNNKFRNNKNPS